MSEAVSLQCLRGDRVLPHLDDLARLRMQVFRDWPYLYEGDPGYERDYLAAYAASPDSVFVLALAGDRVVGASTGLPLLDDDPAFAQPFLDAGLDPRQVFYFGESVLLPAWRGRGLGHAFFDHRQAHARALGRFALTAFCAVDRAADDLRRPAGQRDHAAFWHKRGYRRRPGLTMQLEWNEREVGPCSHALTFWTRALEPLA